MKEIGNTKIIGVDQGYGNMKTASTVTPTGITAYTSEPIFSGGILEYQGTYYRIGEGHKEFVVDKSEDEDYYILTLAAIAREMKVNSLQEADVHLAIGLPLTWVRNQKEQLREYMLRNEYIRLRYEGKEYRIHITGCSVFPQGYPAIVDRLDGMKGTNLLADIGNGTMNILYFNNKKPVESKSFTEKIGVYQCMIAVQNAVMDTFGVKIEANTVEQVLRFKTADIGEIYLTCIETVARKYVSDLFTTLRKYEYNPDLMRLFIVGGGGCLVKNFGEYEESRVTIIDDICATAKGYEYLAYTILRRKGEV
ncbi:MAG TPA: plasmid segregation actin-type ATPase ParM [Lachnospiraceae bacterium]|nr:plasmid segregation actin-type ATPase ParM [Lachnospiraceae bacterium]